ncbi:ribosome small subunit-dependent GTPase A [Pseudogracilibacillus sp. SE30717A]|uniref:ribosome small subunit-dependent GTPase A n=1 Tax=Pseudogracilibacillus sp. SE30717A TaxID=3098293 RepID=UPI00300E5094
MAEGRIIKALSGFYYVQSDNKIFACKGRGVFRNKKITPLVGDYVTFDITENEEGYIQNIKPRSNELVRPPIANITQAIIVNAVCQPTFSPLLLDRFLVIVEAKQIHPMIIVTKKDLATEAEIETMIEYKADYESLGYTIEFVSLIEDDDLTKIRSFFQEETTVLMGQSGVGKSTLLNAVEPEFKIETGEISTSLGRGKHTTRHVELWAVDNGLVADTPGFSSIDFTNIETEELSNYFVEIREKSIHCKFRSCVHVKEPHCAVKQAVEAGEIKQYRYNHYLQFLQEIIERKPRYSND